MKIVVMVDGQPRGPLELDALKAELQQGRISPTALAWHEGREGWTELRQIPEAQALFAEVSAAGPSAPIVDSAAGDALPKKWYYLEGDQTRGPSSTEEIKALLTAGSIPSSTFLYREGMKDWAKAATLAEFQDKRIEAPVLPCPDHAGSRPVPSASTITIGGTAPPAPVKRNTQFMWWPASILASSALAAFIAFASMSPAATISTALVLSGSGKGISIGGFLMDLVSGVGLILLGYGLVVALRYWFVIAPHRRRSSQQGVTEARQKIGCYDFVLDNPRTFIITGIVVAAVMLLQVVLANQGIAELRAGIDSKRTAANSLQGDAENLAAKADKWAQETPVPRRLSEEEIQLEEAKEYRRLIQGYGLPSEEAARQAKIVGNAYREANRKVAGLAQEGNDLMTKGMGLLSDAATEALQIKALKGVRLWAGSVMVIACACSLWLRQQARKERITSALPAA